MDFINLVALLAIIQYLYFGMCAGRARTKYGIKAPAMTGHEQFERAARVQMNTLELLVAFLPALYIAEEYASSGLVGVLGVIYLIGRMRYQRTYMADPSTRSSGFMLSAIPIILLIIIGLFGAIF